MGSDEQHPEKVLTVRELDVELGQAPDRIDRWLTVKVAGATRSKVQEAITAGAVTVNGSPTKANYRIRPGDRIRLELMKPPPIDLIPQDIPLAILYEDDDLLVVDKPAGMVTHPGFGNRDGTLVNAVLFHVGASLLEAGGEGDEDLDEVDDESGEVSDEGTGEVSGDTTDESLDELGDHLAENPFEYESVRPGVVHRLDKDTSGVMVVAKTSHAKAHLGAQFADRTIAREYLAVAWGEFDENSGEIEGPIARDPHHRKKFAVRPEGKYALTRWHVLERYDVATLLAFRLATGRTHQIRVHSTHIGRPLIGDRTYGGGRPQAISHEKKHRGIYVSRLITRQALHARLLGFEHPRTGQFMEFEAEVPADMERLIEGLGG